MRLQALYILMAIAIMLILAEFSAFLPIAPLLLRS
jgi:hypothetical protein